MRDERSSTFFYCFWFFVQLFKFGDPFSGSSIAAMILAHRLAKPT